MTLNSKKMEHLSILICPIHENGLVLKNSSSDALIWSIIESVISAKNYDNGKEIILKSGRFGPYLQYELIENSTKKKDKRKKKGR